VSLVRKNSPVQGFVFPLIGVFLCLFSAITQAVSYSTKQDVVALIDQKMRVDGIPGISFAVVQQGQIEWTGALGLADVEHTIKAHPDTVYRSASLVKPLTATAILQLHQAGELDLDAPVWNYCTQFPAKSQVVTTRQLLTHTAGVRSYAMPWSKYEAELYSSKRYKTVSDALSIFSADSLLHEPGSTYKYTSYGYNVLGCVIVSISGLTYEKYIARHIIKPSKMVSTFMEKLAQSIGKMVGLNQSVSGGSK